ncbi:MAG: sulfatase-like hydrolase/transferase [Akkermansiaceae bacterium]|nr:sulfatase-like hydrolase/transferase [Akkermansiaceae bacterium]
MKMKPIMLVRPLFASLLLSLSAHAQDKPNVLFILCDDLGYGDLGVLYQNDKAGTKKFATPNLDTMAAQGIQLRSHYTPAPVCAPARASLMTGVHQGHSNVRDNQFDKALEDNHTLATVLKQAGYATSIVGKWGLQGGGGTPALWPAYPTKRGFDYFYGYVRHGDGHSQYPFHTTVDPDGSGDTVRTPKEVYDQDTMVRDDLAKCYTTDLFTARAKKWIVDHRAASPTQPFFLYLAYTAPHAALQVPTTAYPSGGGLSGGLQWNGTSGNMINTATGTVDSFIHPDYASKSWTANEKRFATMVRRIDDCVGDLLEALEDLGIDDNTLVVFTSDNGPHHESYFNASYDANSFNSFGPFDGTKRDCWEGGIREPALARWPGTIPAGRISNRPSQFHDWMPTFAEVAGLPVPSRSDGVSLINDLTGVETSPDSTVYIEYFHNGATKSYSAFDSSHRSRQRNQMQVIFQGGYKGVRYDIQSHADPFEIYDLTTDPQETNNLATSQAAIQEEMKNRVLRLRMSDSTSARPYDNEFIPGLSAPVSPGVAWKSYDGTLPWVPDFSSLTPLASGNSTSITPAVGPGGENFGLSFDGYLQVPTDGDYTFYLPSSGGSHLRIHEATVIEDDFARTGAEPSGTIRLLAGLHPFRLNYRHASGSAALALDWSGPSIARETLTDTNLRRYDITASTPPAANDDPSATPQDAAISIPVLLNDSDDGFPNPISITSITKPSAGTATIDGASIVYTPSTGFLGEDIFTYTITDGQENATATVRVNVFFSDGDFWYPLNQTEGTTTYEAGGGSPATLQNFQDPASSWVPGRFGYGLTFDSVDDFVSIDDFPGILGTNDRTCAAWVKTTAAGGNRPIIAWGPNTGGSKWIFLMNPAGQIRVEITNGFVVGTSAINDGNWHHVACTFANDDSPNADDIKLYVDGALETLSTSTPFDLNTGNAGDATIGADIQNRRWNGVIDEARILPRALSLSEIADLATTSPAEDPSDAAWWKRHFGDTAFDWMSDFDSDGISNLAEYAFGGRPRLADLPSAISTSSLVEDTFSFEHLRLKALTSSLDYQLRHSGDLENWQNHPASPASIDPDSDPSYERVTYEITPGTDPDFFRIRATKP